MADATADINASAVRRADLPILIVQHHDTDPAGLVGAEAAARGLALDVRRAHVGEPLPAQPDGHAGIVLLGGAMSAADDAGHPHFPALLTLIRDFAAGERPVLGICLGAQLVARAFGGAVRRMAVGEFGHPVQRLTAAAAADPLFADLEPEIRPMHWHDDEVELPPSAVRLVEGAHCLNQAFRIGRHVYATQFHFEVDDVMAQQWLGLRAQHEGAPEPDFRARWAPVVAKHGPGARRLGRALAARWLDLVPVAGNGEAPG
jgi:GMP synthase-like glutamine amidotransferase